MINFNLILPNILLYGRQWLPGSCIWNRNKIGNVKWLDVTVWEDYAFDIECANVCNDIIYLDERLVFYDVSGTDKLSFAFP